MKYIVLLFFLLTSCSNFNTSSYINPDFEKYVASFEHFKGSQIRSIEIIYKKLDDSSVGLCRIYTIGKRIIFIDPDYWSVIDEDTRELLIFHELGHCDLNLDHTDEYTIMNPFLLLPDYYRKHRLNLILRLFNEGL